MKKPEIKGHTAELINNLFQIILVTYLTVLLLEQIFPGLVSSHLNLNWFLLITIILGILDVFTVERKKVKETISIKDYILIGTLGILGTAIIKYKTSSLGLLSWTISLLGGIVIILLSLLIIEDEED